MEPNLTQSAQPVQPQTFVAQTPTPAEPKKSFPKWPLIIAGVILILILIGGAYLLGKNQLVNQKQTASPTSLGSPKPTAQATDPTATWKIYSSATWNFRVSYPSDWKVISADKPIIYLLPPSSSKPTDGSVSISLGPNDPKPQTPSWFKNTSSPDASAYDKAIWAIKNNDTDEIMFWKNGVSVLGQPKFSSGVSKNIYMQILSTIKFNNQTNQADTSTWKTYNSSAELTLSFKYPSSWTIKKFINSPTPTAIPNVPWELERLEITSKNGTKITYAAGGNYNGGGCSDTAIDTLDQVLPLPHAKGLNLIDLTTIVGSTPQESIGVDPSSPKIGNISNCSSPHLIFSDKTNPNIQIIFGTDKLIQTDKQEAIQILESLSY